MSDEPGALFRGLKSSRVPDASGGARGASRPGEGWGRGEVPLPPPDSRPMLRRGYCGAALEATKWPDFLRVTEGQCCGGGR